MGNLKTAKDKLVFDRTDKISAENLKTIDRLNHDELFSNPSMNRWARELAVHLTNLFYRDLQNPEPVDLTKNTFSKVLNRLRVIDHHIQKPLEDYTPDDMNDFIMAFTDGKIKPANKNTNKQFKPSSIKFYVREFRRLWTIYRYVTIKNTRKPDYAALDWGRELKAPKNQRAPREDYPYLSVAEAVSIAENLTKEEYTVRTLLSINLMGRKCEIENLELKNIDFRKNGEIWVTLPEIKKSGGYKVPVELYSFVKKPLLAYLNNLDLTPDDRVFQSNSSAYAKNLRETSEKLIKKRITPKTLRKIGVCIAEQNGHNRADVERIGGWAANSAILDHYFNHGKGVGIRKKEDRTIEKELHGDVYSELERRRNENRHLSSRLSKVEKENQIMLDKLATVIDKLARQSI